MRICALTLLALGACQNMPTHSPETNIPTEQAAQFAELALSGIVREFPNKPSEVQASAADALTPRAMHPAFFGSFDWHSSVHSHWMLVRILHQFPDLPAPLQSRIKAVLSEHLSTGNMQAELSYFEQKHNRSFERMYGWAWYLTLCREMATSDDAQQMQWAKNLAPLENLLAQRVIDYLPRLAWPNRVGVHQDTAFALGMILDWARARNRQDVEALVVKRSIDWYSNDTNWPAAYEPSGEDFFSAGLNEADLMRRVLSSSQYSTWLDHFLPHLATGMTASLLHPVVVPDVTDGKIVHLAGLNLSRAWCLRGIASALRADDSRQTVCAEAAQRHTDAGLAYVFSGHYEGEHWLASFAVYLLTGAGL
ncbi:MAG: DUF2891 domain-containing protein [Planctomycetes bacterium]|jgi:hypothetical protein|nr:DUF2891 domain-containing protein [Planctomycetota bacterium]MBT4028848.1 DUF2891 domain-containing protein [Planctomycetota bacterium]MBT4559592.1 DUF2891 domain-containing protein [Planctomycetota bacterium]MBT5121094.1 DUF2891 domain-containing protein [Planctomycetota bacterium]MBT7012211.1 DUF2891 domain-containing protein [Planctomycetota bacterium]